MQRIKQAVILCAGLGTRLKPITNEMPKPMVPICGKPMLLWNIEQFRKYGVTDFKINLHYLPDVIKNYFGDGSKFGARIEYSFEKKILGTAGALREFEGKLEDNFFLIYGDVFSLINYNKMENRFFELDEPIGMQRVVASEDQGDADVAELDKNYKFIAVHPKPHLREYQNTYRMKGVFILNKKALGYVRKGEYSEIGKNLIGDLIKNGKNFYGYECKEFSKGIDTWTKLKEVEDYVEHHNITL